MVFLKYLNRCVESFLLCVEDGGCGGILEGVVCVIIEFSV